MPYRRFYRHLVIEVNLTFKNLQEILFPFAVRRAYEKACLLQIHHNIKTLSFLPASKLQPQLRVSQRALNKDNPRISCSLLETEDSTRSTVQGSVSLCSVARTLVRRIICRCRDYEDPSRKLKQMNITFTTPTSIKPSSPSPLIIGSTLLA